MSKNVENLFEYYNFDEWIEETSLAFVRESDAEKDFINVALLSTNIVLGEAYEVVKSKNEEEQDYYNVIISLFAPLIMNYFVNKYYFGFNGVCCENKNPKDELFNLLGSKVKLKNVQSLKKLKISDYGGC